MDHLILNLEMVLVLVGFFFIALNAVTFRYIGDQYLSLGWIWWTPLCLAIILFSPVYFKIIPKWVFLLKSYCWYFLGIFAFLVMLDGVQYTPFPTVDAFLGDADRALKIKDMLLMNWAYAHPILLIVLKIAYQSVVAQWLLMPLLLFFWGKKQDQREPLQFYLVTSLLAFLIGAATYYFFPRVGPASIYSDTHFNRAQIDTVLNFKQIHQYLMITTFDGGILAFPSFHVLWSVITIYIWRKASLGFFAPLLLLNLMAIGATLFLGWNYAIDIAFGVVIGFVAICFAKSLVIPRLDRGVTAPQTSG